VLAPHAGLTRWIEGAVGLEPHSGDGRLKGARLVLVVIALTARVVAVRDWRLQGSCPIELPVAYRCTKGPNHSRVATRGWLSRAEPSVKGANISLEWQEPVNTLPTPDPALVNKLVIANRILYDQGIVDGLGHVSVRHDNARSSRACASPSSPGPCASEGIFLLSCNRAPGLVKAADIVSYDFDGNAVSTTSERPYLERFIHSEIYRARPDVFAVVHSHSPGVIPFGVAGQRLRPIYHMAGFLGSGSATFEIRDSGGETEMLIRNPALGKALAESLAGQSCVLMRGHGSTTVGSSIEQAVYRAIYAETNAKLQAQALALGSVTYLTEEEARLAAIANDGQIGRSWDLWQRRVGPIDA